MSLLSGICTNRLTDITTTLTTAGISTSGPPTSQVIYKNRKINGKSVMHDMLAEVPNSRTDSNARSWCENVPAERGMYSMRKPIARRNKIDASVMSALRPARSSKYVRIWLAASTNKIPTSTPTESDHKVEYDSVGMTRS